MLEEIIIALLIVVIGLMIYFNINRSGEKEDFNIQSIKDVQVEIKEKIIERDTLDLESIEKAKLSSETEAKILREELKSLKELIENERKQRGEAYGSITENVKLLQEQYKGLEVSANKLSSALKDSSMRGNWGEVQLKRVIEHSNMVNHIDYVEQKTIETSDGIQRPDAIVKMPGGRQLVIDSKAPGRLLDAYESEDIDEQERFMKQFADDVWDTVKSLGLKSYQDNIKDESGNKISPDFVIMFMPGEHMLQIALLHRPTLWEEAVERNVILASPYILLALLRSIFYSWQQEERNNNANRILEVTEQLAERINTFVGHIEGIGKGLKSSIKSYNKTIGSYNHKLLPSQKRLNKLKGASENLIEKEEIDELPREVQQKLIKE
uniref:DNA recombination protein (FLOT) n=1 Tax=uncultured marine group II/III euryarchaeote KM3_147_B09 TaxID=1457882 RepID=A0A075GCP9_9EURY|nr:DNA recombination protein (FLOT) [uncultured marine group II/III euryarchaeote KM3_147_B09]